MRLKRIKITERRLAMVWWLVIMAANISVVADGEASTWWIQIGTVMWAAASFITGVIFGSARR